VKIIIEDVEGAEKSATEMFRKLGAAIEARPLSSSSDESRYIVRSGQRFYVGDVTALQIVQDVERRTRRLVGRRQSRPCLESLWATYMSPDSQTAHCFGRGYVGEGQEFDANDFALFAEGFAQAWRLQRVDINARVRREATRMRHQLLLLAGAVLSFAVALALQIR